MLLGVGDDGAGPRPLLGFPIASPSLARLGLSLFHRARTGIEAPQPHSLHR